MSQVRQQWIAHLVMLVLPVLPGIGPGSRGFIGNSLHAPLLSLHPSLLSAVCCWFVKLDLLQVQYMNRMGSVMALLKSPTWTAATDDTGTVLLNCHELGCGCS